MMTSLPPGLNIRTDSADHNVRWRNDTTSDATKHDCNENATATAKEKDMYTISPVVSLKKKKRLHNEETFIKLLKPQKDPKPFISFCQFVKCSADLKQHDRDDNPPGSKVKSENSKTYAFNLCTNLPQQQNSLDTKSSLNSSHPSTPLVLMKAPTNKNVRLWDRIVREPMIATTSKTKHFACSNYYSEFPSLDTGTLLTYSFGDVGCQEDMTENQDLVI